MSKSVDERVVRMQLDNQNFEANAKATMSTLDKLKQALNFKGAANGVKEIDSAVKSVNVNTLSSAVDTVAKRFSNLGIIGVTALQNITNQAVNTAKNLVNQLTLAPITSGFAEYETQIGAIQTILANTSAQGTTLNQVNAALDELNTYADKTIYNFTEMTRNIGTFTAAGVDLKTSTEAIKGIANLAAMSGSTSAQASTAMYQLSQALAAGRVSLQDWNSVVNAGMGGKVFQEALMQTAEAMGIVVDRSVSFRESISSRSGDSWLTSDVLLQTLRQFTGDLTDAELAAQGFNEEQIAAIQAQAKTANEAATQVKTLTQLFDTAKEAVGSGWTQTWEIIVGDFEEAKDLFTDISNVFGDFVNKSSEARNNLLSGGLSTGWKQFLNEGITNSDDLIQSIRNVSKEYGVSEDQIDSYIETYGSFEKSLKAGWMTTDILAAAVEDYSNRLSDMSEEEREAAGYTQKNVDALKELNDGIKDGSVNLDDFITKMNRQSGRENIIEGLSEAFRVLKEVISPIGEAFDEVFEAMKPEQLYDATVAFRDFFKNLSFGEQNANNLRDTFQGLFSIVDIGKKVISEIFNIFKSLAPSVGNLASDILSLTGAFGRWFTGLNDTIQSSDSFTAAGDTIVYVLSSILDGVHAAIDGFSSLISFLGEVGDVFSGVFGGIKDAVGSVFTWIGDNITLGDIFAGLSAGGIVSIAKNFKSFTDTIKDALNFKDFFKGAEEGASNFKTVLTDIHDSLVAFQEGIRTASLLAIAAAVTLMVSSLRKITELTPDQILGGIISLRILVSVLNSAFKSLLQTLKTFSSKGVLSSAAAMVVMAKAVDILADAMVEIGSLSFDQIISGLVGVGGGLAELVAAVRLMGGSKGVSLKDSVALLAIAEACNILADAIIPLSQLSWDELARGLTGAGVGLGELVGAIKLLNLGGGGGAITGGIGILITSGALYSIATNLQTIGAMPWDQIERGIFGMGAALLEVSGSIAILSKISGGWSSIQSGLGMFIGAQSLYSIATNLQSLSSLSWEEIKRGLTAMGVALLEVAGVTGALGKLAGFSGLLGGGSLLLGVQSLMPIAEALQAISTLTWDEVRRGLNAMGAALLEVGGVTGALGKLAGLSGLLGGGSLLIGVQSLMPIAEALLKLSELTWDDIGRGLAAMGGALFEVGAISGALGIFTGIFGAVGAGSIAIATTNLDDLATALQKFGEMSWDEIGRGLTAMGSALGEVALGSFANIFSFLGAGSLSTTIEPLGQLADAMKKWSGVTVPEGLDAKLSQLASGVGAFTLAGWGADALSTIAGPLGTLADSIKKWSGVVVPEGLGDQLSSFAGGINSFTLSGWGADSISTFAEPLGVLADSVKKWQGISVSEDLGTSLGNLADGIGKFTFSGWGADNLVTVASGMSGLADAISKWQNISIPEGLGEDLQSLAGGVASFAVSFIGGLGLDAVSGPLGNFVETIKKWNEVKFPANLGSNLTSLAEGIKSFGSSFLGSITLGISVDQISGLADTVSKFNGVDISGVGGQLTSLASGISAVMNSGINQDVVTAFTAFVANFKAEQFGTVGQNIQTLAQALNQLSTFNASSLAGLQEFFLQFSQLSISTLLTNFSAGFTASIPTFQMYATQIVTTMVMAFTAAAPQFMQVAMQWGMMLTQGLNSQTPMAVNAARTLGNSAKNALSNLKPQFKVAGQNAGAGFVEGILEYVQKAAEAAAQVAQAAIDSMNRTLDSHSPSRVMTQSGEWGGEGFVIGLLNLVSSAKNAGTELADGAIDSITEAIGKARDVLENTEATQPTIRPVVDLSDVSSKARAINQTFSANRRFSVGVTASKVASASAGFSSSQNGVSNSESTSGGSSKVNNISFTQNNYSPKALSRSEIYRDTSNQFSMLKEAVFAK